MGSLHSPNAHRAAQIDSRSGSAHANCFDVDALREENKQLRELIVQLSEIVIKSVLDRK
jgi:hypothetical protein